MENIVFTLDTHLAGRKRKKSFFETGEEKEFMTIDIGGDDILAEKCQWY